jgi:hypothetical protein
MASIATSVVVAVVPLIAVYLIFLAVVRGSPDDRDREIEVKLFPPSIRLKIKGK